MAEEKLAEARQRAMLADKARHQAKVEQQVEEPEEDSRSPLKQKGRVVGEQLASNCCMTQGFKCQAMLLYFDYYPKNMLKTLQKFITQTQMQSTQPGSITIHI